MNEKQADRLKKKKENVFKKMKIKIRCDTKSFLKRIDKEKNVSKNVRRVENKYDEDIIKNRKKERKNV